MQQCSKKLISQIIHYFPIKYVSSMSTKSPLQAEKSTFFWQRHRQKVPLRMHQNMPFQVQNSFFLGRAHRPLPRYRWGRGTPSPYPTCNKPCGSTLRLPRVPARFTPLDRPCCSVLGPGLDEEWRLSTLAVQIRQRCRAVVYHRQRISAALL